ncbi:MAG TPA: hypothetical protein VJ673_02215 [Aromatoleum sp.]|uniref:exo-rhamnogalacturonan lyase family protein n=1 Tax=Aromatoleum sp. TaxID=2307007 RepID=UPI002B471990|nr:hypothetical protein [Aromatoleum sp.]HJV24465.1 hypothetical protein [Aromatoleum sp.]
MIAVLRTTFGLVLLCFLMPASALEIPPRFAGSAYEWRDGQFSVPLTIKDNSGVERRSWPVTTGVPLPYGVLQDPADLRLVDENGREIPLQTEVLARYWARDNSIRWVLLDFQVNVQPGGKTVVFLQNKKPAQAIAEPVRIDEEGDAIVVKTGTLTARVSKKDGAVFKSVSIDTREILRGQAEDGPWLRSGAVDRMEHDTGSSWNTHGWNKTQNVEKVDIAESVYRGAPVEVSVETRGPLRSVVVIRGRHMPGKSGRGILREGMYNYTTRLHFYRGQGFVKVEHAIENSDRTPPLYNHLFREAGLSHSLRLANDAVVTGGGLQANGGLPAIGNVRVGAGQQAWLYQGEAHSESKYGGQVVSEGGYQLGAGRDGAVDKPVAAGKRGRFLDVSDAGGGVAVMMRYLWEHAPRAIGASSDRLQVVLQADSPGHAEPRDGTRPEYDLDFGRRQVHDALYYFHRGDAQSARVADVAEAFEYPLFALAPPAWYSDSEAWYFEIARSPADGRRSKVGGDGHWIPNGAGIKRHGENGSYNSGGHHDSLSSGWLDFLSTGQLADLEKNLAISRWTISQNPGWVYRDNHIRFGDGAQRLVAVDRALADWNVLAGFGPKDFYTWQSDRMKDVPTPRGPEKRPVGGWSYLNGYKILPDMEHYAMFRLFEYYYLFGDRRALDAIYGFVNWDINFQHVNLFNGKMQPLTRTDYFEKDPDALWRGHYARVYSWMLYTNLAGFQATGSPVFDEFARWQVRRMLGVLRSRHGQLTSPAREEQLAGKFLELFKASPVAVSKAQTWMEAQSVLALHEAYRTYGDERILDGLWGQADYFAHHVLFYPKLGMLNNWTTMPSQYIGEEEKSVMPQRHDHMLQPFPYLYHYTGWPEIRQRYESLVNSPRDSWVAPPFTQVIAWERENVAKRSTTPPDAITDLRVVRVARTGVTLSWTAPKDDGPSGRAERYFVKYSEKPIVEFAPTDNPQRAAEKQRVVTEVETAILSRQKNGKIDLRIMPGDFTNERSGPPQVSPDWDKVNAFWMAEHVAGEPTPGAPGTTETFTMHELLPHEAFGAPVQPTVENLKPGTYYVAICSWDADRNLSRLSNVVRFEWK